MCIRVCVGGNVCVVGGRQSQRDSYPQHLLSSVRLSGRFFFVYFARRPHKELGSCKTARLEIRSARTEDVGQSSQGHVLGLTNPGREASQSSLRHEAVESNSEQRSVSSSQKTAWNQNCQVE